MRIRSIRYEADSGWIKDISFGQFEQGSIYLPRVGDTLYNQYGEYFKVKVVEFSLESDHVTIFCKKVTRASVQREINNKLK